MLIASRVSNDSRHVHYFWLVWSVFDDELREQVTYHISEPVDPTEYQNEYIGQVIGIY